MTVSGDDGRPGRAALGAVEEDFSLRADSATLLFQLEVENIARGNPRSSGPATANNVGVGFMLMYFRSHFEGSGWGLISYLLFIQT